MYHKAKKSMGQNFLKSAKALSQIISAGEINLRDTVLEIGPGKGALTEKLLETSCTVVAVEKDKSLFEFLNEKFAEYIKNKKLILTEDDILEFDISKLKIQNKNYKIVANIPYNITGAILKKFLSSENQPASMTLLVQKEVAERIVTRDKKESILSVSVKVYGMPKYIAKVPARYFSPAPKVDSAIIHIGGINKEKFNTPLSSSILNEHIDLLGCKERGQTPEDWFFTVVKTGFAHKRKMAISNLSEILKREDLGKAFATLEISEKARPEEIPTEKWLALSKML